MAEVKTRERLPLAAAMGLCLRVEQALHARMDLLLQAFETAE